jgi:hemoglobin/transferrin/lactoferrin receptor protein
MGDFDYGIEVPTTDLKPEKSTNFELGYKLAGNLISLNVAGFYTKINDLIDRVSSTYNGDSIINGSRVYTKANVGEAFVSGFELDLEAKLSRTFSILGNLTYTYGQNITKDEPFRRIPPLFGNIAIRYHKKSHFITLQTLVASKQDRLSSGDIDDYRIPDGGTPGWFVVNIKGGYNWKKIGVKLALNNLFNEAYRMHGSGMDGLGIHLAGSIRFYF